MGRIKSKHILLLCCTVNTHAVIYTLCWEKDYISLEIPKPKILI